MPTPTTLERFIARVEENKHVEAIKEFYAENASMQENQGEPRVGRAALMTGEARVLARAKTVTSQCVRPVLGHGEHVAIRWIFSFDWLDGSRTRMEEVALAALGGRAHRTGNLLLRPGPTAGCASARVARPGWTPSTPARLKLITQERRHMTTDFHSPSEQFHEAVKLEAARANLASDKKAADASIRIDREEIAEFCRARGIRKMSLFGSVVRDDFDPDRSDVDVLVELAPDTSVGLDYFGWADELSRIFGRKADLSSRLNKHIEDEVRREALTIYEQA